MAYNLLNSYCINGNLELVQTLMNIDIHKDNESAFKKACLSGSLEIAKLLFKIGIDTGKPINVGIDNDHIFRECCLANNVRMAKWILDINPRTDVHYDDEYVFRESCKRNNVEIVEWLLNVKPGINIHAMNDYAFRKCCKQNNEKIINIFVNESIFTTRYIWEDQIGYVINPEHPVPKYIETIIYDCTIYSNKKPNIYMLRYYLENIKKAKPAMRY
jgi:hypothetical protein